MRRKNLLVRVYRALSGRTQMAFAKRTGIHHVLLARYEQGQIDPSPGHLRRMGQLGAGLTVAAGERLLDLAETLRQPRKRAGGRAEDFGAELSALVSGFYHRLLNLPLPPPAPRAEDRHEAAQLWQRLAELPEDQQLAVVRVAQEFQTWALAELVCEESVIQTSRDVERTASLARLAREIAEKVPGTEGWRNRIRGYAVGHVANSLRLPGELEAADVILREAKRLWAVGCDPAGLLDPGRLLSLEGALRRDQRRFAEALDRLAEAAALSPAPELALIQKGFTLEVMGDYERAVGALLEAQPLVESRGDDRLCDMLHQNLALNLCHLGRYGEAAELGRAVRTRTSERGDEILVIRGIWLEGRVAAGLGRREEALRLLAQARAEFDERNMSYDVALTLLEEAVLLLEEGRTAEVKELAGGLSKVFESKGVHREALGALRLFKEAVEQEAATAELARRVLGFLFRARHDEGLPFTTA
ncbi:MAG TPA: helix-turn-helix transcriptional regulator [Thermoanaerobaculia bacterium]|jgi:tetratricopeptide (TPR) repeat protein|nr:helix-turn-helix transcriptional regulator [Thermoanaerobaculia bacterium]